MLENTPFRFGLCCGKNDIGSLKMLQNVMQAFSQDEVIMQMPLPPKPSSGIAVSPSPSSSSGYGERCIETPPLIEMNGGTKGKAPSLSIFYEFRYYVS